VTVPIIAEYRCPAARSIELHVADLPAAQRGSWDVAGVAPMIGEGEELRLSCVRGPFAAYLVALRDPSRESYWEPVGKREFALANLVFWRIAAGLYDGREWRSCWTYGYDVGRGYASRLRLRAAFEIDLPAGECVGNADSTLQYWWCPKASLIRGAGQFTNITAYVLRPRHKEPVRSILMRRNGPQVLQGLLDECRLIYMDASDGEQILVLSRVLALPDILHACRRREVRVALQTLNECTRRRRSWHSLPQDVEASALALLRDREAGGLRPSVMVP